MGGGKVAIEVRPAGVECISRGTALVWICNIQAHLVIEMSVKAF